MALAKKSEERIERKFSLNELNVSTMYGIFKQEAQGLGALLDKMEDNGHINWITQRSRCIFHSKDCRF